MPTDQSADPGNRAVSALFRVFGGRGERVSADAVQQSGMRVMHLWEFRILSVWIPLTVFVAIADAAGRWLGSLPTFLLAIPICFIVLNLLPFAFGGRTPSAQWRIWLAACTLWAVFFLDAGSVTGWIAWTWIVIFVLNLLAVIITAFLRSLGGSGPAAIAWRMILLVGSHLLVLLAGIQWGWHWAILGGGILAVLLCLAILRPGCQWLGPVICETGDNSILITIDDGPDPRDTPVLLDLLDHYQRKAVIFMIGEKVRAHPELAREVIRRGHEIGNHTMTHPQASFWCAGPWRTRREIQTCGQVIEESTGVKPRWFRAPVGHRNLFTHPIAAESGLQVMAWNRRGYDAVETDANKVLSRILSELRAGDIILLHEATPIAAEVLEGVLQHLGSMTKRS